MTEGEQLNLHIFQFRFPIQVTVAGYNQFSNSNLQVWEKVSTTVGLALKSWKHLPGKPRAFSCVALRRWLGLLAKECNLVLELTGFFV